MAEISNTVQPLSDFGVRTVGVPKFIKWDISGDKVKYDLLSTSYIMPIFNILGKFLYPYVL